MRHPSLLLSGLAVLLATGSNLCAQSLQSGAIVGAVSTTEGKPVAGASVRVQSGQTAQTVVTNAKGDYRFSLLNPGPWVITVVAKEFQTNTAKLYLGVNETQTANFKLIGVAQATVEVVTSIDCLDMESGQITANINAEAIAKLPADLSSQYGLEGVITSLPGVLSTGSNGFQFMGGSNDQNLFVVDGNITNNTKSNLAQSSVNGQPPREFMENVDVVTGGFGAEYNVLGGVVNMVTKTGTNQFTGETFVYTNFPNSNAVSKINPKTTPPQTMPAPIDQWKRYGCAVSGPIIKDKVFFFVGFQGFKDTVPAVAGGAPNWNGLYSDQQTRTGPDTTSIKLNWIINDKHQLILSGTDTKATNDSGHNYPNSSSQAGTLDSGYVTTRRSENGNLTWNWAVSNELILVTSLGKFLDPYHYTPTSPSADGGFHQIDDYRYFVTGPGRNATNKPPSYQYWDFTSGSGTAIMNNWNPNEQFRMDMTWIHNNHEIKAGYQHQSTSYRTYQNPLEQTTLYSSAANYGIMGDPTVLEQFELAATGQVIRGTLSSYYVKDIWEVVSGLRVDFGFRFDPFRFIAGNAPFDGQVLENFSSFRRQVQPRLGVVWDLKQDGRTKLFANFGRYFETMPLTAAAWATASVSGYNFYNANHYTYNQNYTTGPAYTINLNPTTGLPYAPDSTMNFGSIGKPQPHASDLRLPHKDSILIGMDQLLGNGWSAGASWTYWSMKDILEDSYFTNSDGSNAFSGAVTQKVIWNPRPGPVDFITSTGAHLNYNSPFPDPKDRFISLNLHSRYSAAGTHLAVDYTWTHHYGNYRGISVPLTALNASNNGVGGGPNATTDWDFYRAIANGNIGSEPVHQLKISGYKAIPMFGEELNLGPVLTWQSGFGLTSGQAIGIQYSKYMGPKSTGMVPDNIYGDMGVTPTTLNLSLNANMAIKAGRARIQPSVSLSNVFNSRRPTSYYTGKMSGSTPTSATPGLNYDLENAWQPGRAITAGISVKF